MMSKSRSEHRVDSQTRGWAQRQAGRADAQRRSQMLRSPGWSAALEQFARATGLAVTLFDAQGHLLAGPFTPTPLARELVAAHAWDKPAGKCFATDAALARECVEADAVIRRKALDTLALFSIPARLEERPIGAIIAGWVFDTFPDPISTDRLAKNFGIAFTELWQIVRQQPPVSHEKLSIYAELLQTLADAFLHERAETLQQQQRANELLVLNESGQCLTSAASAEEIGAAVVDAAMALSGTKRARFLVASKDGEWQTVVSKGFEDDHHPPLAPITRERHKITSTVRFPVEAGDRSLLGLIEIGGADRFTEMDCQTQMSALCAQAAVALQKVRLIAVLERERASLERANRTKDEFLAVLSHELRTPLTPILGWATMLSERVEQVGDGIISTGLAAIERNARQELHLVDEMLDLSRILNDKVHLNLEFVDPKDALASAFAGASALSETRELQLRLEIEEDLPLIQADPQRLQQVLSNLISNAVKFTPSGGSITLRARRAPGKMVEFVIDDTGVGIKSEFLPYIFERFRQADSSTTRNYGGLGIGLSVVRGLVELHKGRVRVESEGEGRGSTFIVSFPATDLPAESLAGSTAEKTKQEEAQVERVEGRKVLFVDDSADTLTVIKEMIESVGYEVETAGGAGAAMEVLERFVPDCIVTDVGMPETDGFSLLKKLREDERFASIPVIALTGYATQLDREAVLSSGFAAHLAKPIDKPALIAALAEIM